MPADRQVVSRTSARVKALVVAVLAAGTLATAVLTIRLAIVVFATPADVWLVEVPALVQSDRTDHPMLRNRADQAAGLVSDPVLTIARLPDCPLAGNTDRTRPHCLAVIDDALAAGPSLGELWLERARTLLRSGERGTPLFHAMARSHDAGPREGWLATGRAILGIQLFPILPEYVRTGVIADLELTIPEERLVEPLVTAYLSNPLVAANVLTVLDRLPIETQRLFLQAVEART